MRIVEIIYMWPPETFLDRHAVALSRRAGIELILAGAKRTFDNSSTRQPVKDRAYGRAELPEYKHVRRWQRLRMAAAHTLRVDRFSALPMARRIYARALAALKPDLVHFHFTPLALDGAWCANLLKIPYTVSIRQDEEIRYWADGFPTDPANLITLLEGAAGIHTVGDRLQDILRAISPNIPPPHTIRTIIPPLNPEPPSNPPLRFVSAGRLVWIKGYSDLVKAMAHLPDASLDIVGEGRERDHLRYLILSLGLKDRVRLLGSLSSEAWVQVLQGATAYVQASLTEGFSNALGEAMALGKPVFATDVGCTSEIVRDGENGLLIPVGDPRGMAERLALATDDGLMRRIGAAARTTAQRSFDEAAHAEQFEQFFRGAIARASATH